MTAIELLGERQDLELSPFVYSWHPRVADLDAPREPGGFYSDRLQAGLHSRRSRDVLSTLQNFVRTTAGIGSGDGEAYKTAFAKLTDALVDILSQPNDTSYLRPIFDLCPSDGWLALATLNYDLTIEQEALSALVPLSTGVEAWMETGEWQWSESGIRLLKVHGSINWEVRPPRDAMSPYRLTVVDSNHKLSSPSVLFGGRNKLRADGPFLELLAQFELMLREAQTLLIVGYSFRDVHVNAILRRWVHRSINNRVIVVDPQWDDWRYRPGNSSADPFRRDIDRALAGEKARPAVEPNAARPGRAEIPVRPRRLTAVGKGAKSGLPEAVAIALAAEEVWPPAEG